MWERKFVWIFQIIFKRNTVYQDIRKSIKAQMITSRKTKKISIENISIGQMEILFPVDQSRIQILTSIYVKSPIDIRFYLSLLLRSKKVILKYSALPAMAQWVKDLALPLPQHSFNPWPCAVGVEGPALLQVWYGSQLWLRFDPGLGASICCRCD